MKTLFVTLLLFLSVSGHTRGNESVYGIIRKSQGTVFNLKTPYFITFMHEGKLLALPIDTQSKDVTSLIRNFVDKDAMIEGEIKEVRFKSDGQDHVIGMFYPKSIRPLDLGKLGATDYQARDVKLKEDQKKIYDGPTLTLNQEDPSPKLAPTRGPVSGPGVKFRVPDAVANTLIFTGAAVILGTQLLKK